MLIVAGDTITKADYYTTVEEQQMFSKAFPEMAVLFQQLPKGNKKRKHQQKGLMLKPVNVNIM